MPPSHCWMTGSVAMEINTGPHSLVLKKKCSISRNKGNKAGHLIKIK